MEVDLKPDENGKDSTTATNLPASVPMTTGPNGAPPPLLKQAPSSQQPASPLKPQQSAMPTQPIQPQSRYGNIFDI